MPPLSPTLCLALEHLNAGDVSQAAVSLKQALQTDPKDPQALFLTGKLFTTTKQHTEALGYFRQAVALKPMQGEYQSELAMCLVENGEVNQAAASGRHDTEPFPGTFGTWLRSCNS